MALETIERTATETVVQDGQVDTCIHHWVIEPPEAPTSRGACKKCGAQRVFVNYVAYSAWENELADDEQVPSPYGSFHGPTESELQRNHPSDFAASDATDNEKHDHIF